MPEQTPEAIPISVACASIGLPVKTFEALRRAGLGPVTFRLGRRAFVRRETWAAWLASVEASGGVAVRPKPAEPRKKS